MDGMNTIFYYMGTVLHIALNIYLWIIIIGALISWVNPDPYNPIVIFLRKATEPLFFWLRRHMPLIVRGIDLSPIIAIAIISFLDSALVPTIREQGNLLANLLIGTGQSLGMITNFYLIIVIIAAVISFVSPNPYNPIVRIISAMTEPIFSWFRRRLPLVVGGIDLTPAVVIGIIYLFNLLVSQRLILMGINLKMKGGL